MSQNWKDLFQKKISIWEGRRDQYPSKGSSVYVLILLNDIVRGDSLLHFGRFLLFHYQNFYFIPIPPHILHPKALKLKIYEIVKCLSLAKFLNMFCYSFFLLLLFCSTNTKITNHPYFLPHCNFLLYFFSHCLKS